MQYCVGGICRALIPKMVRMEVARIESQRKAKKMVMRRDPSKMARIRTRKRKEVEVVEMMKLAPMMYRTVLHDESDIVAKIAHAATKNRVASLDR